LLFWAGYCGFNNLLQKNCPKTISLRNFVIAPKIEVFIFIFIFKNPCVGEALKRMPTIRIFITRISLVPFLLFNNYGTCM
jgi:hypothetical protein